MRVTLARPRTGLWFAALLLFISALATCDGGGGTGPGNDGIGPVGGSVSLASGAVTLSIPSGALSSSLTFTATPTSAVPTSDLLLPGSTYDIGPSGTTFALPVTLTLSYDLANLPVGVEEGELRLYKVVGSGWEIMANASVNTVAHTVSGGVTSLSQFGARGLSVATVEVTPSSSSLEPGGAAQLTATPRASDGRALNSRPIRWSSSEEAVATVDNSGLVTAVGEGTATITAMSGGRSGTATVTVTIPVGSVEVTPGSGSVDVGQTHQLTGTPKDASGNVLSRTVSWSSSDEAVATVDANGLVTGIAEGTATITATSEAVSGSATVTVNPAPVASVEVTPSAAPLVLNQTQQLTATARDASGNILTGRTFIWTSSDASVATVDAVGQVTGIGVGTATINATIEGVSGTATITVTLVPVASVEVAPSTATLTPGQALQFSATASDADGNLLTGRTVTWASSNESIATVDSNGLVTAVRVGTAAITATIEGQSNTSAITVSGGLAVTTTSLADGVVGTAYSQTLAAAGGDGSYTWSVSAGSLPAGLSLNFSTGVISDTPTAAGTTTFTVQVTSAGQTATKALSITVIDAGTFSCSIPFSEAECRALISLYNATNGPGWTKSDYWLFHPNPCVWHGVTCDGGNATVYQLQLDSNNLNGPIPPELGNLPNLQTLILSANQLTGSIPPELGNLSILVGLDLYDNQLTGLIPPELGNLSRLSSLYLSDNQLIGSIPPELGNLSALRSLWLWGTQVTGPIPPEFGNLSNIQRLSLAFNQLTGPIPAELGSLPNLGTLDLRGNQMTGSIPPELGASSIGALYLSDNQLTGSIPPELGNLSSLRILLLDANQLTGSIPSELGNLSNLGRLVLSANQLSGVVPLSVAQLGGLIQTNSAPSCILVPPGNDGLILPDNQDYRAADLDSDGKICGLGLAPGITTPGLPDGVVGTAYSQTLAAAGGDGSYSWAVSVGLLPPGLSMMASTGVISGTPTTAGTSTFTVQVTSAGQTGTKDLHITVTSGTELGFGFGDEQFSLIQAGTFQMGSTPVQSDEIPVHSVNITQPFYVQKTEVTQAQWQAVMGSNPSHFSSCGDACPVEQVSWNDIQVFLTNLNAMYPGMNFRLPTEAEWEYAARAGTTGDYGGTGILDDMGWHYSNSNSTTHPAAQKQPNAWGLYDMHGNVFEWVQDWYSSSYYSVSPTDDPTGPAGGSYRVLRGGSWNFSAGYARSAYRNHDNVPTARSIYGGFRLVKAP